MEIAVGTRTASDPGAGLDAHVAEAIGPGVVLLAIAEGFGRIGGVPGPALAVDAVREGLSRRLRSDGRDARASLIAALANANAHLYSQSGSTEDRVVAGTSLTAALIVGARAHVAHVGRTRAHLVRDGALTILTADDELDGDAWSAARSTAPTDAMSAHLLTRTLGSQPALEATVTAVRLAAGDALILSTGAFHAAVDGTEIAFALHGDASPDAAAQRLIALASGRARSGGTVIVGRALAELPAPEPDPERRKRTRTAAAVAAVLAAIGLILSSLAHVLPPP